MAAGIARLSELPGLGAHSVRIDVAVFAAQAWSISSIRTHPASNALASIVRQWVSKMRNRKIGLGIAIGVGAGAAIGSAMGDIGIGVGVGLALGLAIGSAWKAWSEKSDD